MDGDDLQRYELSGAALEGDLLFVSQQHHPHWRAVNDQGIQLEDVRINSIWQGFSLPAGTRTIELSFEPWVRLAWVPQLLFGILLAALGVRWASSNRKASRA